ncbi:MAG: SDR family oxidoreductase [Oscillatoria sp. SIO1A7]|nr:SDR family oxidoreductase [Oscillatoria sp. SIO1A7]
MYQFQGKVALVTGASSGIGKATAISFARAGAKVVLASRGIAEGEKTARDIQEEGGEAIFVRTDVSKSADVETVVHKTLDTYGRLDCAFNNAAIFQKSSVGMVSPLTDWSEEDWNYIIDVNLKGMWLCLKYEIPAMIEQGSGAIVNTASVGAIVGVVGSPAYSAAKGGIIALMKAAAIEYAKSGIRINAVSPGSIKTKMLDNVPADLLAQIQAGHPLGRIGKPEEIAEAVLWLCSDKASFVTGHNLIIDGGYTAQ